MTPAEGAGVGRGKTEWEEQMATTVAPRKNRVSASESEGARRGKQASGRHAPEATAGTQKTRPSAEK